jgi:hypothetical protein
MRGRSLAAGIAFALPCIGLSTVAVGGSVTQPGETVGVPAGAPLPQGLYLANTADWVAVTRVQPAA